jgi:diguanylate cyclase (GGDEF)-like protein
MQLSEDISRKVAEALERPRWSSADPKILALLFQRDAEQNRRILRLGMWAAVLSYVSYGIFDWFLFPDVATQVVVARVTLGVLFLTAIEIGVRKEVALPKLQLIAASALVLGAIGWLLLAIGTTHQEQLSHFIIFGTVFVLGANLFFNFKFFVSVISSAIIAATFVYYIFAGLEAGFGVKLVIATFFVNCLVFSLYLSYRLSMERYWTFLHALQAKTQEQAAIANGEKLVEIANTDPLTGLRNRRAIAGDFTELYKQWMTEGHELGMILVDVDFFKKYNDSLGHQAGDDCLLQLANTFGETAALNDAVVGRYGGEEFIVLARVNSADHLADVTRQFCNAVELLAIPHPTRGDDRGDVDLQDQTGRFSRPHPAGRPRALCVQIRRPCHLHDL